MTFPTDAPAARRAAWPVRQFRLGEEPPDDLIQSSTAEERLAMLASLSEEAWALTGEPVPAYRREETPVVVVPLKRPDPSSG